MCASKNIILAVSTIFTLFVGANSLSNDLPPNFPRCSRSHPKLEECMLNATEQVRPYVSEGIPNLLPSAKKFMIPQLTISNQQGNRAFNFHVDVKNLTILGLDQYKFNRYLLHLAEPLTSYVNMNLPFLYLKGHYELTGKLFFAYLKGNGILTVNITDSNLTLNYTLTKVNKDGEIYLNTDKPIVKMKVGNVVDYSIDGLFNESKDLEKVTKEVINSNLHILVEESTPAIEKVVGLFLQKYTIKFLEYIPFDKLHPPN